MFIAYFEKCNLVLLEFSFKIFHLCVHCIILCFIIHRKAAAES